MLTVNGDQQNQLQMLAVVSSFNIISIAHPVLLQKVDCFKQTHSNGRTTNICHTITGSCFVLRSPLTSSVMCVTFKKIIIINEVFVK